MSSQARHKATKLVIVILLMSFAAFVITSIVRVGTIFWLYADIAKWVTVRLGLDYYAAQLVSVVLTAVSTLIPPYFTWFLLFGKSRLMAMLVVVCSTGVVFGLIHTVGKDVYFDRQTGEPLRYVAETPEGQQFSFTPGFDPKYGIEYKPYTKEMAAAPNTTRRQIPSGGEVQKVPMIEFRPGVSATFSVYQKRFILGTQYLAMRLMVKLLELRSERTFWSGERASLRFSVCNADDELFYGGTLYLWYTPLSHDWTINWKTEVGQMKPDECKILGAMSEALSEHVQLARPLGTIYLSVTRDKVSAQIDLNEVDSRGLVIF